MEGNLRRAPLGVVGLFSHDGLALFQANATGRNAKTVREFLEKYYSEESTQTRDEAIILAVRGLLEVVQSGSKNIELAVMEKGKKIEVSSKVAFSGFNFPFFLILVSGY